MPKSRRPRRSKHAPGPRYDVNMPIHPNTGDIALTFAGQAIEYGDFDYADRCLRLAERYYRTARLLLSLQPSAFDWAREMEEDEAAWEAEHRLAQLDPSSPEPSVAAP